MNVPELRFTEGQIAELFALLDANSSIPAQWIRNELVGVGRWFTEAVVLQNQPTNAQVEKALDRIESATRRLRTYLVNPHATPYLRMAAGDVLTDDCALRTAVLSVSDLERWSREARNIVKSNDEAERRVKGERDAIGEAIAEANARGERKPTREAITKAIAKAKAEGITKQAKGKAKGAPDRSAMRVLVHKLALLWLYTHGKPPTVSVSRGIAGGRFVRFAQGYIEAMRAQTTDEHRQHAKCIDAELNVSADKIVWHLKAFTARLKPRSAA